MEREASQTPAGDAVAAALLKEDMETLEQMFERLHLSMRTS